jgi:AcrR family transcriptional regulator
MGIGERKQREKESLRQEILAAAGALFAKEGAQNLSMRKIAEKIEYSPTTIYLYFKDKNDLIHQICENTFAQLAKEVEKIRAVTFDPIEILKGSMKAYIEFGLKHPNHYEIIFITPLERFIDEGFDYPFEGSMGQVAFEKLGESVAICMQFGVIKQGDIDLISQILWAGMHGLTSLLIGHKEFPFAERDKLVDAMIDTLITGIKE